ncbi:MAG: hypothetical protein OEY07_19365 [Gammaproteobacteria bacterium]|nr:hypothetical protein [Gammaproteobacteria bacterium]
MSNSNQLYDAADKWITSMGGWIPGERVVYRGKDLHTELHELDWLALFVYGITGRYFTENQLTVLNAVWTCTSFPDPRIWNNGVVALAGTARSSASLGISAALAISDAGIYGNGPCVQALEFVLRAAAATDSGVKLEVFIQQELDQGKTIYGFGRPLTGVDERIPHLMSVIKTNGLHEGKFLSLILKTAKYLHQDRRKLQLNVAGIFAGLAADMGFTAEEYNLFIVPLFLAGMPPIFLEASSKPAGTFFPLRCEQIVYHGKQRRRWTEPTKRHTASAG